MADKDDSSQIDAVLQLTELAVLRECRQMEPVMRQLYAAAARSPILKACLDRWHVGGLTLEQALIAACLAQREALERTQGECLRLLQSNPGPLIASPVPGSESGKP